MSKFENFNMFCVAEERVSEDKTVITKTGLPQERGVLLPSGLPSRETRNSIVAGKDSDVENWSLIRIARRLYQTGK